MLEYLQYDAKERRLKHLPSLLSKEEIIKITLEKGKIDFYDIINEMPEDSETLLQLNEEQNFLEAWLKCLDPTIMVYISQELHLNQLLLFRLNRELFLSRPFTIYEEQTEYFVKRTLQEIPDPKDEVEMSSLRLEIFHQAKNNPLLEIWLNRPEQISFYLTTHQKQLEHLAFYHPKVQEELSHFADLIFLHTISPITNKLLN